MIRHWHTAGFEEIFRELGSGAHGMSAAAAAQRLSDEGGNALPETKADGIAALFVRQFESPLIYILLAACGVVLYLGETVDAIVIFLVLFFNAIVGAYQEGRAQNTLRALKTYVATSATVLRDGSELLIPDGDVVRGDVIILQEGEKVPADARILESRGLKTDEAALTGESEPVSKIVEPLKRTEALPPEQLNMVFKGTTIVSGHGKAIVVATGTRTVVGGIAKEVATIDTEIPLKGRIRRLSNMIIGLVAGISVLIFALGMINGLDARTIFVTVVSLAVSVIPEGLPIVITLVLATGVWRMSRRHALVRKLQAVEALGQARIIAVDKTGTITKNELVVRDVWTDRASFSIGGIGYDPKGDVQQGGKTIDSANHPELLFAGKMAAFCASAHITFAEEEKRWKVTGDPTEAALRVFGEKVGFKKDDLLNESPFVSEIPFDYTLKFHATAHEVEGHDFLTVIGAPEAVLARCTHIRASGTVRPIASEDTDAIHEALARMSEKGLRILAGAYTEHVRVPLSPDRVEQLTFVGLYGMQDVLRPEVQDAMRRAKSAGIRVVMITGDHRITARAIAQEAGIWQKGDRVLTGEDLQSLSELQLSDTLPHVSVFARVSPQDKLRIVQAYKKRGEIIAMTGDGVNDAPPLVAADLGVAMGGIGTEVAKEAADIVLLDDNFGSIVSAVEEGRTIYSTIKKVILYMFSTSLGEVLTIVGALTLGYPLPLLATQIIWLNFVTDGFLTVALAMEPKDENLLTRAPDAKRKDLLDAPMLRRMTLMALPMSIGTLWLFAQYVDGDLTKALTMSLTVLAVFQWFNAWNCRSRTASVFAQNPFSNPYLIGATVIVVALQLLAVYTPFLQGVLHTTPLSLGEWCFVLLVALSVVAVEEGRKLLARLSS